MADGGEPGGEGLLCARDEEAAPFAIFTTGPKVALSVAGFAFLCAEKVDFTDPEAGGIEKDFAGSLWAGKADAENEMRGWRGSRAPCDGKGNARYSINGGEGGLATGAIYAADIKGIAYGAPKDLKDVLGLGAINAQGVRRGLVREEQEIHGDTGCRGLAKVKPKCKGRGAQFTPPILHDS